LTQEIVVGFRTPAGVITTIQSFKTMEIPRLVRGKPGAWDPLVCLDWGNTFLSFLRGQMEHGRHSEETVWRVKFVPRRGIIVSFLDGAGVEDVMGKEDRVGFLPTWYWELLHATRSRVERREAVDTSGVHSGWRV
jgi:RAT1-interacting protein